MDPPVRRKSVANTRHPTDGRPLPRQAFAATDPGRSVDADPDPSPGGDVELVVLGGPGDGPTLRLHHERFAYAGKFVMSGTGKAIARSGSDDSVEADRGDPGNGGAEEGDGSAELAADGDVQNADDGYDDDVLAAVAFDRDRTDGGVLRIRYVTVRRDRRGEGLGPRLLDHVAERALDGAPGSDGGIDDPADAGRWPGDAAREVRIAVNNPFAYEAAFKAGFGYTGERTGLAELTCARPGDRSPERYRRGLSAFGERESLEPSERAFLAERLEAGPPPIVESPPST